MLKERFRIDDPDSYQGSGYTYLIDFTYVNPAEAPVFLVNGVRVEPSDMTIVYVRGSVIADPSELYEVAENIAANLKKEYKLVKGEIEGNVFIRSFSRFGA